MRVVSSGGLLEAGILQHRVWPAEFQFWRYPGSPRVHGDV